MKDKIESILNSRIDPSLTKAILDNFQSTEESFLIGDWKKTGLSAGHFAEAIVRVLELELEGAFTPVGRQLRSFNENRIASFASRTGDDSLRFHIPRALFVVYGIRNKKGIGHLSAVAADKSDANLLVEIVRWILSTVVALFSNLDQEETSLLVRRITERRVESVWKTDSVTRVLRTDLSMPQQIILLLYSKSEKCSEAFLVSSVESSKAYIRRVLRDLHKKRLVEYHQGSGECELTPIGMKRAEELIHQ